MRKYILGFIVGIVIISATQAYGGAITLIGKDIKNEVVVNLLGKKLSNKAPLIDGVTYVPIREVTESLGLTASFVNGEVVIKHQGEELQSLNSKIKSKNEEIAEAEKLINACLEEIKLQENLLVENPTKTDWIFDPRVVIERRKEIIVEFEFNIIQLDSELAELETQKVELEKQQ